MGEESLLSVRLRHRQGSLRMEVEFCLSAPWTVLFGPSGIGKSTVLRAIAGFVRPDECRIASGCPEQVLVSSAERCFVPAHLRPVRSAGQTARLFPGMRVRESVAYGLGRGAKGASTDGDGQEVVEEVMALFRLSTLAERRPGDLSGGERQRVSVARAVVSAVTFEGASRPLLLLDEPFSGLDACTGSFCAWIAEDWTEAYRLANEGLLANPGNALLINNAAVALLEQGQFRQAVTLLTHGRSLPAQRRDRATLAATEGMLFFRIGMFDEGRRRYNRIITFFENNNEENVVARAALILAREEILANTSEAESSWKRADALMPANPTADLVTVRDRVAALGPKAPTHVVASTRSIEPFLDSLLELPATL